MQLSYGNQTPKVCINVFHLNCAEPKMDKQSQVEEIATSSE